MPAAPGFGWVRRSSRVKPADVAPYEWLDEQTPQMRKLAQKERIHSMNESNPRYLAFQIHLANEEERKAVAELAMLTLWKYRHSRPITQTDYDNLLLAHTLLYNNDFKHMIPGELVARVADRMLEQEVIN